MTTKQRKIVSDYLNNKLNEFTTALNYWGAEANKTDNPVKRQQECDKNILHFKTVYDEIFSMVKELELLPVS